MTRKLRLILFLAFGLFLALFILLIPHQGYSATVALTTPQQAARSTNNATVTSISYFILVLLNSGFYLLAKFNLKNSAEIGQGFNLNFNKTKRLGDTKLTGETEPFAQIELRDALGNYLNQTVAQRDGSFYFYVEPKEYTLNISKFGFEKIATDVIKISQTGENRIKIKLERDEMINKNSPLIVFFSANQKFWIVIFVLGLICAYLTYPYLGFYRTLFISLTSLISLIVYLGELSPYLRIIDRPKNKTAVTKIKILNHKDEKLDEVTTDRFGRVKIIAAKGFYKVSVPEFKVRTFQIKENREIIDLALI